MSQTQRSKIFDREPNEKVADVMAGCSSEKSEQGCLAKAEFYLRQTDAIQDTAECNKRYTKYMFWSVVILAISSVAQLVIALLKNS